MSHLYNLSLNSEGLVTFTTESGDVYTAYFLEYPLEDSEGNQHMLLNFDFLCNGGFECDKFSKKHDKRIKNTLVSIIESYFIRHEHAVIVYFCFNEDGYGRHRSITFRKWLNDLPENITKIFRSIDHNKALTYSSMLILSDNPLKDLIIAVFEKRIADLAKINR